MADQEWTNVKAENGWNYPLARGEIVEVVENNGMSHEAEQEPESSSPHMSRLSTRGTLTEVSSWLSEHRTTGCFEVHHPSLAQWCADCNGTRKQQELPTNDEDRL